MSPIWKLHDARRRLVLYVNHNDKAAYGMQSEEDVHGTEGGKDWTRIK